MHAINILNKDTFARKKTLCILMVKTCYSLNKVLQIITDFLQEDKNNYKELRSNLSSSQNIFQYVYSNVFPEIYCWTEKRGFDLKSNFHITFKTYKDKQRLESFLRKNPENYQSTRNETYTYEQKPINVDDFNEVEKKELRNENKNGQR